MIILRLLPVRDGDHAVHFRVTSFVLVVHEGEFEVRGVLGLVFRVWTVFKRIDKIRASALVIFELVRVDLCAVVVMR